MRFIIINSNCIVISDFKHENMNCDISYTFNLTKLAGYLIPFAPAKIFYR